jgi:hypothetical protein
MVVFGTRIAKSHETMTSKPSPVHSKASPQRPARKVTKGATETSRLFIDVNELVRKTQAMPLTRYVE